MIFNTTLLPLTLSSLLLSATAFAHDPELHKKENAEKPKCEAMKNMDHSKMDMKNPILLAMMKQCESSTDAHHGDGHGNKEEPTKETQEKHGAMKHHR
jgi:hypothetical protein